jgi:phytoene/squalene synthetase
VRYSDEIVDTFHTYNKRDLLQGFKNETYKAIEDGISLNPVLHSFQQVVRRYKIEKALIESFLKSMEMDLEGKSYDHNAYSEYIYGSAEVVGLMCLRVFCEGDGEKYEQLKEPARKLGAAFQKVNFIRDIKSDYKDRGRVYFPNVNFNSFNTDIKAQIEIDIQKDFDEAYAGLMKLPNGAKLGVYLAYIYYLALFKKIKKLPPNKILSERIRISDNRKFYLLLKSYVKHSLNSL